MSHRTTFKGPSMYDINHITTISISSGSVLVLVSRYRDCGVGMGDLDGTRDINDQSKT